MSELRETTYIEIEESNANENRVSLSELLAGVGWLAFQGGRLAVRGAIAGAKLGTKLAQAARQHVEEAEVAPPLTIPRARQLVAAAPDAGSALRRLAAEPAMTVAGCEALQWKDRLAALSPGSDKLAVAQLAEDLLRKRQERLHGHLLKLASGACETLGFTPKLLKSTDGLLVAQGSGSRKLSIEVEKKPDGGLVMHLDAHGFRGGECVLTLDRLQAELAQQGVRCRAGSRKRTDRGPAVDASRIGRSRQQRQQRQQGEI